MPFLSRPTSRFITTLWACALMAASLTLLGACAASGGKDRVLRALFDGVPPSPSESSPIASPGVESTSERAAGPGPVPDVENPPPAGGDSWIPPIIPATRSLPERTEGRGRGGSPPLEAATDWQALLNQMPVDSVGAVDWIAAIDDGLLSPELLPADRERLEPPFTVGALVELGLDYPERPFLDLDIEILSADTSPLFSARFPHSSHTLLLACSSCHPGVVAKRTQMDGILDGAYCGECHGKVAFEPEVGCARCHTALEPPSIAATAVQLEQARAEAQPASPEMLTRGADLYEANCAVCHGSEGDGGGRLAAHVQTKPRDFTSGTFKFRSTIGSSPPTDLDLFRTITRGVAGTSMPAWSALSIEERWALVHYIKTFSDRFEREPAGESVEIPIVPEFTAELLQSGEELYRGAGCHNCHGDSGRGDGPSAAGLTDDWGEPIDVFDLSGGRVPKNGGEAEDFYRLILTGLPGTPMPGFGLALQPEQTWAITAYVQSLRDGDRRPLAVRGDIHFERRSFPTAQGQIAAADIATHAVPEFTEAEMPPAVFPHWSHRVRFKCSSCHPDTFEMEAGANPITMDSLRRGEYCATCHNGTIAWQVGFESCVRCHAQP